MKIVRIEVRINESDDKVGSAIKTEGYERTNISHQFEILGILDNLKGIIQNRINELVNSDKLKS